MSIYTIGDLHLSLSGDHAMDQFPGWRGYVSKIKENWQALIEPEDTVILPGDFSWGLSLEEALADFRFLQSLPGHKILLKGNHDYWWTTRKKMEAFFSLNGLDSIEILHNNSVQVEGITICGSRGWLFETGEAFDDKIINREAMRLEASLAEGKKSGKELVAFLHYPPVYGENQSPQILDVLTRYGVRRCYYGHIHSSGCRYAMNDVEYLGIRFYLVSADFLGFRPVKVARD